MCVRGCVRVCVRWCAQTPDRTPVGWTTVRVTSRKRPARSSSLKWPYKKYIGPQGEVAKSVGEAWQLATAAESAPPASRTRARMHSFNGTMALAAEVLSDDSDRDDALSDHDHDDALSSIQGWHHA